VNLTCHWNKTNHNFLYFLLFPRRPNSCVNCIHLSLTFDLFHLLTRFCKVDCISASWICPLGNRLLILLIKSDQNLHIFISNRMLLRLIPFRLDENSLKLLVFDFLGFIKIKLMWFGQMANWKESNYSCILLYHIIIKHQ